MIGLHVGIRNERVYFRGHVSLVSVRCVSAASFSFIGLSVQCVRYFDSLAGFETTCVVWLCIPGCVVSDLNKSTFCASAADQTRIFEYKFAKIFML